MWKYVRPGWKAMIILNWLVLPTLVFVCIHHHLVWICQWKWLICLGVECQSVLSASHGRYMDFVAYFCEWRKCASEWGVNEWSMWVNEVGMNEEWVNEVWLNEVCEWMKYEWNSECEWMRCVSEWGVNEWRVWVNEVWMNEVWVNEVCVCEWIMWVNEVWMNELWAGVN